MGLKYERIQRFPSIKQTNPRLNGDRENIKCQYKLVQNSNHTMHTHTHTAHTHTKYKETKYKRFRLDRIYMPMIIRYSLKLFTTKEKRCHLNCDTLVLVKYITTSEMLKCEKYLP